MFCLKNLEATSVAVEEQESEDQTRVRVVTFVGIFGDFNVMDPTSSAFVPVY